MRKKQKHVINYTTFIFIVPAFILIMMFILYPLFFMIYTSFHSWNGLSPTMKFIGIKNYLRLFKDGIFWLALRNNLIFSALVVLGTVGLGLLLSLMIYAGIRGWKFFRSIYYFPVLLTSSMMGLLWVRFYEPYTGLFNQFLKIFGFSGAQTAWLSDPNLALFAVILKEIWQYAGFPMMIILGGLFSIPEHYLEAALVDGASFYQALRHVILPLCKNVIIITIALQIVFSFKVFDPIWAMTLGGPGNASQVLTTYMYYVSFGYSGSPLEFGYACTIATVMALIITPIGLIYLRKSGFARVEL